MQNGVFKNNFSENTFFGLTIFFRESKKYIFYSKTMIRENECWMDGNLGMRYTVVRVVSIIYIILTIVTQVRNLPKMTSAAGFIGCDRRSWAIVGPTL